MPTLRLLPSDERALIALCGADSAREEKDKKMGPRRAGEAPLQSEIQGGRMGAEKEGEGKITQRSLYSISSRSTP